MKILQGKGYRQLAVNWNWCLRDYLRISVYGSGKLDILKKLKEESGMGQRAGVGLSKYCVKCTALEKTA